MPAAPATAAVASTPPDRNPAPAGTAAASPAAKAGPFATMPAPSTDKPGNAGAPDPGDALRVGSYVVAKYWEDGEPIAWWLAIITAIDKNDFMIRWPSEPKVPPLKIERKFVAILSQSFDPASEWRKRR